MIVWVLIALGINASNNNIRIDTGTDVYMSAEKCLDAKAAEQEKARQENKYKAASFECYKREVIK